MIKQKLQTDQIQSLKTGDKNKLEMIRYILAQIQNKEIDKRADLTDEETVAVLRKIDQQLKESIEAFEKGGRNELTAKSKGQLAIVNSYLPKQISDEALRKEIKSIIKKNKQSLNDNPKAVIGICIKALKTKADPQRIIKICQLILG